MIKVILDDSGISYNNAQILFAAAAGWAAQNCPSYQTYETVDVSDFSLVNDIVAEYLFTDERDATLFRLKWK